MNRGRFTITIVVMVLIVLISFLFTGCTGSDITLFPEEDIEKLKEVGGKYNELLLQKSKTEARNALVELLNDNYSGVSGATLFEDGYTVFIRFEDGYYGGLNTIDVDMLGEDMESVMGNSEMEGVYFQKEIIPGDTFLQTFVETGDEGVMSTPRSRKAIFLNVSALDFYWDQKAIDTAKRQLMEAGWEEKDIVLKTRSDVNDTSITMDDFFFLEDYGIIAIFAHGNYGTPSKVLGEDEKGEGDNNKYFYLQACSQTYYADKVPLERLKLWQEWIEQGKIITLASAKNIADVSCFIRSDLLQEQMEALPNSLVYFSVCYGWNARYAFINNGCGDFLGWDDSAKGKYTYPGFTLFFQLMAQADSPQSDYEVYTSPTMTRTGENAAGETVNLWLYPDPSYLYLPTWASIVINNTTVPEDTYKITVDVSYTDSAIDNTATAELYPGTSSTEGTIEKLLPSEAKFVANALDIGDEVLKQGTETVSLTPGKNEIIVDLGEISLEYSLRFHERFEEVPDKSYDYYIWMLLLVWDAVEGVEYYKVSADANGYAIDGYDGFEDEWERGDLGGFWQEYYKEFEAEFNEGKRFYLVGLTTCGYRENDLSSCYESKDEYLDKFYNWTFEIVLMEQ